MTYCFPKTARILTHRHYAWMSRNAQRYIGRWIVIEYQRIIPENSVKLGITVTKHFGKAHERNRFKRIVREAYRLCRPQFLTGLQIVIKPKNFKGSDQEILKLKTEDIVSDLQKFLQVLIP